MKDECPSALPKPTQIDIDDRRKIYAAARFSHAGARRAGAAERRLFHPASPPNRRQRDSAAKQHNLARINNMNTKNILNSRITRFAGSLMLLTALTTPGWAPAATWVGTAGDGDWNNSTNWDIGVPAEGTNAVIGLGYTVNYTNPMTATSFGALTDNGVLNISSNGFNATASSTVSGSTARLYINSGGAAAVTSGNLTFTAAASGSVAAGGSLSVASQLNMGASGSGNTGFMTNNGGVLSAATTRINPNNLSSTCRLIINGGTNDLGNVSIYRSGSSSYETLGTEGLVISNGLVRMTSLSVGTPGANSHLTMFVGGGRDHQQRHLHR
jgi:hypothetical protein